MANSVAHNAVAQIPLSPEHLRILRLLGMETAFKEIVERALERFLADPQSVERAQFVSPSRHYDVTSVSVSAERAAGVVQIARNHGVHQRTVYHHALVAYLHTEEQLMCAHRLLDEARAALTDLEGGAATA